MKIVITESQYKTLIRRYSPNKSIEDLVGIYLNNTEISEDDTFREFYDNMISQLVGFILRDMLEHNMFRDNNIPTTTTIVKEIKREIELYIEKNLKDTIKDYYYTKHSGRDSNLNELELKERCWKGYSQKGMKTMFGKRYPNCVKIKK
jgi:hypothetical protein